MTSIRIALGLAAVGLFVGGCGSESQAGQRPAPAQPPGGAMSGKLLTHDGRPIERARVSYDGWPDGALGTMVNGRIASPANGFVESRDGRYELKVPPGQYTTEATALVRWHDREYAFKLEPADGADESARAAVTAERGVARDYVWKMAGPRPGKDASYLGTGWSRAVYGASIDMDPYQLDKDNYRPIQADLRVTNADDSVEFTLVPKGKLIDGSEGKTIVERVAVSKAGQHGCGVRGIPVGDYTCSARIVRADGSGEPLRVSLKPAEAAAGGDGSKQRVPWAASVDLVFEPEQGVLAYYGTKGVTVYVGK